MKYILIQLISFYQHTQPLRHQALITMGLSPQACRYQQTCSSYAIKSLGKYGTIRGVWLALKRLSRCHSFYPASRLK